MYKNGPKGLAVAASAVVASASSSNPVSLSLLLRPASEYAALSHTLTCMADGEVSLDYVELAKLDQAQREAFMKQNPGWQMPNGVLVTGDKASTVTMSQRYVATHAINWYHTFMARSAAPGAQFNIAEKTYNDAGDNSTREGYVAIEARLRFVMATMASVDLDIMPVPASARNSFSWAQAQATVFSAGATTGDSMFANEVMIKKTLRSRFGLSHLDAHYVFVQCAFKPVSSEAIELLNFLNT